MPPPGETVLQNGNSTAKGVLYPAVYEYQLRNNFAAAAPYVYRITVYFISNI
jgi:hypothetical protein